MSDHRDLDRRLTEFLDGVDAERGKGFTLASVHRAVTTASEGLARHELECSKRWEDNEKKHASTHKRLVALESAETETPAAPFREREVSTHDLSDFADRVARSAIEGMQSPDTTPEARVREVVAQEQAAREERREFERLRKQEADAIAARADRKKTRAAAIRTVLVGVLSGAGVAALVEFGRWAATLHH